MNWYFIRHGEIASNKIKVYSGRSDEALTEHGREQVRSACSGLEELDIDAIYSSPLVRTRQSADIIIKQLGRAVPIYYEDSFNELKMGPWEGLAEREVENRYPEEWAVWNKTPADLVLDGRETLQQLQNRVTAGLSAIEELTEYQSVLVVTHVAVIRVVSLLAASRDLNQYKSVPVENARIFKFRNLGFQGILMRASFDDNL